MRATAAPPLSPGRLAAALVKEAPVDQTHFDALTRSLARRPTRRGALRLLIGGLLGGMVSGRTWTLAHALQRPDRDQDGLYDDDEVNVYGTNPDVFDTDGDGTGDGEEIYRRDNGLGGPSNPLVNDNAPPPDNDGEFCPDCGLQGPPKGDVFDQCASQGLIECPGPNNTGYCANLANDPNNCGACGSICNEVGRGCCGGYCLDTTTDPYNCGLCGNACGSSSVCVNSLCEYVPLPPLCQLSGNFCTGGGNCCSGTCIGHLVGFCL
jgi:hypothetical protein